MDANTNLFAWCQSFSIGDEFVDAQHKHLFSILFRLHRSMDAGDSQELIEGTLNELIDYTQRHFRDEEALMERVGYPGLAEHKAQHDTLIEKVEDMMEEFMEGEPVLTIEVLIFLKEWLTTHIAQEDARIGAFIA
ncbi:bacteriohemerythrin [Motiliproteus sp. SC1-56]|uniref:bacteriohemerythrin n=1 Tax=Motiliproteus sp. SC1-56 TaxID=2799565 RepID=UPI001A8D63EC|nr:bacteriohemerythrin [Motiliproteus sp. SC1-56]